MLYEFVGRCETLHDFDWQEIDEADFSTRGNSTILSDSHGSRFTRRILFNREINKIFRGSKITNEIKIQKVSESIHRAVCSGPNIAE